MIVQINCECRHNFVPGRVQFPNGTIIVVFSLVVALVGSNRGSVLGWRKKAKCLIRSDGTMKAMIFNEDDEKDTLN